MMTNKSSKSVPKTSYASAHFRHTFRHTLFLGKSLNTFDCRGFKCRKSTSAEAAGGSGTDPTAIEGTHREYINWQSRIIKKVLHRRIGLIQLTAKGSSSQ
jgi:hypothetical protein